eukprot:m.184098 g.184098  ORF g.184098 m.184098 type:complete len:119 (+) comp25527_c1_seq1:218-574(+)
MMTRYLLKWHGRRTAKKGTNKGSKNNKDNNNNHKSSAQKRFFTTPTDVRCPAYDDEETLDLDLHLMFFQAQNVEEWSLSFLHRVARLQKSNLQLFAREIQAFQLKLSLKKGEEEGEVV